MVADRTHIDLGDWVVRPFRPDDISAIVKYANNLNVWRQLTDRFPHPYTEEDAEAWITWAQKQKPETNFAIASEKELIGGIGLHLQEDVYHRSAMLGYWLGEPYWGRGITTRAVRAVTEWAFSELDLLRIYAYVFESNPASSRVLEKAGYTLEGTLRQSVVKDGQVMDQLLYAILVDEL